MQPIRRAAASSIDAFSVTAASEIAVPAITVERDENAPPPFDLDKLLTNIMLYWIGGINAANWIYVSIAQGTSAALKPGEFVQVPTAVFLFPNDLSSPAPEAWIRRSYNLAQRHVSDRGGHFPAMENGEMLVADMTTFFARYR